MPSSQRLNRIRIGSVLFFAAIAIALNTWAFFQPSARMVIGDTPLRSSDISFLGLVAMFLTQAAFGIATRTRFGGLWFRGLSLFAALSFGTLAWKMLSIHIYMDRQEYRAQTQVTPLMKAAKEGDVKQMEKLIQEGASVSEKNELGLSAMDYAAGAYPPYMEMKSKPEAVRYLLENGASLDDYLKNGWTPLMAAAVHGDLETAEILLVHGANLEKARPDGWTALGLAVVFQQEKSVEYLLGKGANPNASVEQPSKDLLTVAKEKGNEKIVQLLARSGARKQ